MSVNEQSTAQNCGKLDRCEKTSRLCFEAAPISAIFA